jgi:hypothetical protein
MGRASGPLSERVATTPCLKIKQLLEDPAMLGARVPSQHLFERGWREPVPVPVEGQRLEGERGPEHVR